MLIAIAIAEEIQGSKRITFGARTQRSTSLGLHAQNNKIFKDYGYMWGTKLEESSAGFWHHCNAILCNPWISSAMAMAMSICRTLCVLVLPWDPDFRQWGVGSPQRCGRFGTFGSGKEKVLQIYFWK